MAFYHPTKVLNPVDLKPPENVVKGAILADEKLHEWYLDVFAANGKHMFTSVDKRDSIEELTRRFVKDLNLPPEHAYGITIQNPMRYLTDKTIEQLTNGFMLYVTVSPQVFIQRVQDILEQSDDQAKLEWAVTKLAEFATDSSLMGAKQVLMLFNAMKSEKTKSNKFFADCFRTLHSIMRTPGFEWPPIPTHGIAFLNTVVSGTSKILETDTLVHALQLLELMLNSNAMTTQNGVLNEVRSEKMVPLLSKSDERLVLSSLLLMNSLLRHSSRQRRREIFQTLDVSPFRKVASELLARPSKSWDVVEQLVNMQKIYFANFATSPPSTTSVQHVMEMEIVAQDSSAEKQGEWTQMLLTHECGQLATERITRLFENNPQDLTMIMSENLMRTDGGKWQLIPLACRCVAIVAEVFGVLPGCEDFIGKIIELVYSSEEFFDELLLMTTHLFHRTWREMVAAEDELDKVSTVVREQLLQAIRKGPNTKKKLALELEELSYWSMQEEWRREQAEKENTQMLSQRIIDLRTHLKPIIESLVRENHLTRLKEGCDFKKEREGKLADYRPAKGKVRETWYWTLDASQKFITMKTFDADVTDFTSSPNERRQVWLNRDVHVSSGSASDLPRGKHLRSDEHLIRVQLGDGDAEVLLASTANQSKANMWIETLSYLTSGKDLDMGTQSLKKVDELLKMEIRVRLSYVTRQNEERPEIPPLPVFPNFDALA